MSSSERKSKLWLIARALLFSAGALLLIWGLLLVVAQRETLASICLGFGVLLLILSNLGQFELVKGMGMEFKLRATVRDAQVTLDSLHALVVMNARQNVELIVGMALPPTRVIAPKQVLPVYEKIMNLKSELVRQGVSEARIREALTPWVSFHAHHLQMAAYNDMSDEIISLINAKFAEPDAAQETERFFSKAASLGAHNLKTESVDHALNTLGNILAISRGASAEYGGVVKKTFEPYEHRIREIMRTLTLDAEERSSWLEPLRGQDWGRPNAARRFPG